MTKLLLWGRLAAPVGEIVASADDGVQLRISETPSEADVAWADCLSGFSWPRAARGAVAWVHAMGLGIDGFSDGPPPRLLTRTVGAIPARMGDYVVTAAASHLLHFCEYAHDQRAADWRPREPVPWPRQALILGTGLAAQGIARALAGRGVGIVGANRSGHPAADFDLVVSWNEVPEVAREAQLLVDVLPLTALTVGIVNAVVFEAMEGALFVNVGRGATVDDASLRRALEGGRLSAAWLDVHRVEPLPKDAWQWGHPRVRVTPHVAGLTTAQEAAAAFLAALNDVRAGRVPSGRVDVASYPAVLEWK